MKTKFLTGLAVAAALLIGQPVFAAGHRGGGGHPSGGHHATHSVAVVHRSTSHSYASAHRSVSHATRSTAIASRRAVRPSHSYTANINRQTTNNEKIARNNTRGSRNSAAFGGNSNYVRGNNSHGTYAFASHSGWSHNRQYYWHGHHYRWYDNGWFIIDPFPLGYGYWGPNTGYYYGSGAPVSIQVQAALQQQGYYQGPIDGIVGPQTEAAIAAYQQANGLRVTGTITHGLLYDLGVG
jgi:hypothetical protein